MSNKGPHCTVVIPTKNAMPNFSAVLSSVLSQKTPWKFDTIVVDSGSNDGTDTHAESNANVRVLRILPSEFGHGRTRNYAISKTTSPFIAMITHDAQPSDDNWLVNLVAPFETDQRIAGVFGRHIARPEASPFTKRDLDRHFAGFLAQPLIVNRDTDSYLYSTSEGWRQFLHFFSDNNACLRRSVWEQFPYPEVEFAEDQAWAKLIIEKGWSKCYSPNAVVRHSHEYTIFERLQRAFDEARSFHQDFGYNLAPSGVSAVRSFVGLSARDLLFTLRSGCLMSLPKQILLNFMLIAGHYLGNRHDRLPESLQNSLSRDGRIFRGDQVK
jgi:rhamnosyltransferase